MPIFAANQPISSSNFSALFQLPLVPVAELLLDVPSVNAVRILQAEKGLIGKDATVNAVVLDSVVTCIVVIFTVPSAQFTLVSHCDETTDYHFEDQLKQFKDQIIEVRMIGGNMDPKTAEMSLANIKNLIKAMEQLSNQYQLTFNIVQQRVQSGFAADPDTIRLMLTSFYREKANAAYQFHFAKELPDDLRTVLFDPAELAQFKSNQKLEQLVNDYLLIAIKYHQKSREIVVQLQDLYIAIISELSDADQKTLELAHLLNMASAIPFDTPTNRKNDQKMRAEFCVDEQSFHRSLKHFFNSPIGYMCARVRFYMNHYTYFGYENFMYQISSQTLRPMAKPLWTKPADLLREFRVMNFPRDEYYLCYDSNNHAQQPPKLTTEFCNELMRFAQYFKNNPRYLLPTMEQEMADKFNLKYPVQKRHLIHLFSVFAKNPRAIQLDDASPAHRISL